jgi:tetratricopeptide (TPR) repeat protein
MSTRPPGLLTALCLGLLLALGRGDAAAQELTRKQIYQHTLQATGWVVTRNGTGSAWVADRARKLLVTNAHVVGNHDLVSVVFPVRQDGQVVTERSYYTESAPVLRGRVLEADPRRDLALVQLPSLPPEVTELKLATESPGPSDRVHSVGNPQGDALWEYTAGTVRTVYRKKYKYQQNNQEVDARVIETQSPINPGDSGGPVVDDQGELVGVNAGTVRDAQLVSLCIDVSEVRAFLADVQPLLNPTSAADFLRRGNHAADKGRNDCAIADYTEVLRLTPDDAAVYVRRGQAYAARGDGEQAVADFTAALRLDPKSGEAARSRAKVHEGRKDYVAAIADYTAALTLNPKDVAALRGRGQCHSARGDSAAALADFSAAVQLEPQDALTYRLRAETFSRKGDADQALKDYGEAIRLNPRDDVAYDERGLLLTGRKRYDEALKDYAEAARINPSSAFPYNNRGLVHSQKGEYDQALADFTEALQRLKFPLAYVNRGEVYRITGKFDNAVADYTEALRLDPNYTSAYRQRGLAYLQKRDLTRAVADYTEVLRRDPKDAEAYRLRGVAHSDNDENDQGIADYTVAIRLAPRVHAAYRDRATAYNNQGQVAQALADLDEALRLAPNEGGVYRARAAIHQAKGDYAKVVSDYTEALRINPKDVTACNGLAWLWATCPDEEFRAGDKAVEYATKAGDLAGWKVPEVYDTLAAAHAECGQFDKAVEEVQKALELAPARQKRDLRQRLERYQAHKPYRAPKP